MSSIRDVPVEICCSACQQLLLLGHLDLELEGDLLRNWFMVDEIHITCPSCGAAITAADDDFQKVMKGLTETE